MRKFLYVLVCAAIVTGCGSTRNVAKNMEAQRKTTKSDSVYVTRQVVKNDTYKTDTSTTTTDSEIIITYVVATGKDSIKTSLPIKEVRKTRTIKKTAIKTRNVFEAEKQDSGAIKKSSDTKTKETGKTIVVKRSGLFNPKNISITLILLIVAAIAYLKIKGKI